MCPAQSSLLYFFIGWTGFVRFWVILILLLSKKEKKYPQTSPFARKRKKKDNKIKRSHHLRKTATIQDNSYLLCLRKEFLKNQVEEKLMLFFSVHQAWIYTIEWLISPAAHKRKRDRFIIAYEMNVVRLKKIAASSFFFFISSIVMAQLKTQCGLPIYERKNISKFPPNE